MRDDRTLEQHCVAALNVLEQKMVLARAYIRESAASTPITQKVSWDDAFDAIAKLEDAWERYRITSEVLRGQHLLEDAVEDKGEKV